MSLFNSFKKALGFPENYEANIDDLSDLEDADEPETQTQPSGENIPAPRPEPIGNESQRFAGELAADIVNALGGESDSSTLARTAVMGILSKRLPQLEQMAKQQGERTYLRERSQLVSELNELKKLTGDIEQQRQRFETNRISNERQKRALNDRLDDFQKQLLTLEAEREQLQLENRAMSDRLRGVRPTHSAVQGTEYKQLASENAKLQNEIAILRKQLLNARNNGNDSADMEQSMQQIEQQLEKFEEIKAKKDSEIKALRQENGELSAQNQSLSERVAIDDEKIDALEQKVAELHKTIQTNLFDHSADQDRMQKEIKRLSQLLTEQNASAPKSATKKNKKTEQAKPTSTPPSNGTISAIDELMDNTEWFAAPLPGPRQKDPEVTENFGYKVQPKKKNQKIDDNQLTLF